MIIYIASSWKNQHGVEMLTALLREKGHTVISWIENNFGEMGAVKNINFEEWVKTEGAERSFDFDTNGAKNADLVIYYGPSGKDAAAELGIAYANAKPILGLYAKGEDFGLMRKMIVAWYDRYPELLKGVEQFEASGETPQVPPANTLWECNSCFKLETQNFKCTRCGNTTFTAGLI